MEKAQLDELIHSIRKEFYALRNGMIADTLRKGGLEQKYIFGLQLPQIKDIAVRSKPDNDEEASLLARALWKDKDCRESRLLACHMMPMDMMTKEEAKEWTEDASTREESDILAFRLIRYLPFAGEIARELEASGNQQKKYTATAIYRFL